ncbi:diguanylate cyclase (GGDEF)-like protein [Tamilnaduibacter salinus]|uniref:diguanylate cyclase n=1 Tax=Tamilnaduibacter salinus TaxID=1484056 RepID=A0A2A2I4G6_9GAMM|nr:diguanylate cyclase [Tamilnaduibacter salinus]PAV26010.1 GGDEF domain-containing protein [Tamilnaduibacter salinus]PVY78857.1 diguanylate cyclase (GGDEF)-like protein [Tamilnaduibacter salinus]
MPNRADRPLPEPVLWIPVAALLAAAAINAWQGQALAALTAFLFVIMGILMLTGLSRPEQEVRQWPLRLISVLALLAILPAILTHQSGTAQWSYLLPLVISLLWPLRWACVLIAALLPASLMASFDLSLGASRHQMLVGILLTILLSLVFLFMSDYKRRQLAPLRRTDELTQAASQEYLSSDLHKEIQRSDREGLELAVLLIGLDRPVTQSRPAPSLRAALPRVGRFLHSRLRAFDSYYRVDDMAFLAILPGMNTAGATRQGESLRRGLGELLESHGVNTTVSAGVAGLNIGDDAESLQASAYQALRRAQQQGGNRTQSFSAWSGAVDDQTETGDD